MRNALRINKFNILLTAVFTAAIAICYFDNYRIVTPAKVVAEQEYFEYQLLQLPVGRTEIHLRNLTYFDWDEVCFGEEWNPDDSGGGFAYNHVERMIFTSRNHTYTMYFGFLFDIGYSTYERPFEIKGNEDTTRDGGKEQTSDSEICVFSTDRVVVERLERGQETVELFHTDQPDWEVEVNRFNFLIPIH